MNIRRLKLVFFLLLQTACLAAFAEPGRFGGGFFSFGKNAAPEQREEQQRTGKKMEKEALPDEHGDNKRQPPVASPAGGNADPAQKRTRMTPDERRALRRQINEAGHDIYVPGR